MDQTWYATGPEGGGRNDEEVVRSWRVAVTREVSLVGKGAFGARVGLEEVSRKQV